MKNSNFFLREIGLLTGLELKNLFGFNVFRHTKDPKAKKRYLGLGLAWVILILMAVFYVGALTYGLISLGLASIVPTYLVILASLLILAFGIFKAGQMIFGTKGYDMLSALPLHGSTIVISRFLKMYVTDLLLALLIILPGTVTYAVSVRFIFPEATGSLFAFCIVMLSGTLFVPLLPLVISTLFGTIVTAISSRMKHKTATQTLLTILFIIVVLLASFNSEQLEETLTPEMLNNLAIMIGDTIYHIYPPAMWFSEAAISGSLLGFLLFAAISVIPTALLLFVVSRLFHSISRRLLVTASGQAYRLGTLKSNSILISLLKREAKRYFSSTIYVTNTIVGPIMGTIMSVAVLTAGIDTITTSIPLPLDVIGLIPFLLAGIFGMMNTTSSSISMEGKEIWIVKSLPVPTKVWLDSKLLFNLSIFLPFYVVSEILLIWACKPAPLELVWLILVPALLILFSAVCGLAVNIKCYRFDWEKEEEIVKQSAAAFFGGFGGVFLTAICVGVVFITPSAYGNIVRCGICAVVAGLTCLLYRFCITKTNLTRL